MGRTIKTIYKKQIRGMLNEKLKLLRGPRLFHNGIVLAKKEFFRASLYMQDINCIVIHEISLLFLSLELGLGTYLYQETLYLSESCKRKVRKTAPFELPGMTTQVRAACRRRNFVPPLRAGPSVMCPLHLHHLLNLSFMKGMPNTRCILELRANLCFVCNFFSVPRCQCQIARKKTHYLSCYTRNV